MLGWHLKFDDSDFPVSFLQSLSNFVNKVKLYALLNSI